MNDEDFYVTLIVIAVLAAIFALKYLLRGSPMLSVGPRIRAGPGWLMVSSSFLGMLLTLFSHRRSVLIDAREQKIHVRSRFLWFFRRHKIIPFDQVEKILYFLDDLNPGTLLEMTGDSVDCFKVQLRLLDRTDVHLGRFIGLGTFQRGWDNWDFLPDWLYSLEYTFDMSGAQAMQSREFLDRLKSTLGVPIGRP